MISNFYVEQTTQVDCLSHVSRFSLTIHIIAVYIITQLLHNNYYYHRRFYPSIFPCGVVITGIKSNETTLAYGNYEYLKWQQENSAGKFSAFQCLVAGLADWMTKTDRRFTVAASFTSKCCIQCGHYNI